MAKNHFLWLLVLVLLLGAGAGVYCSAVSVQTRPVLSQRYVLSPQRQTLRRIYLAEVGVREKTGHNDGPRVEKYLSSVGLGKGYSWCAAFTCWALAEAGVDNPKNGWAPALFPAKRLTHTPRAGDVFGIYFPNLKRIAHCGFVDKWGDKMAITVEGNTLPDEPYNARDGPGEGVHRKRRSVRTIYQVADWVSP